MDSYIINQWNNTVSNGDIIIHLGDFALCNFDKIKVYANKLNGLKYLIKGNHDHATNTFYESCGIQIMPHGHRLEFGEDNKYILSHKPLIDKDIPEGYINYHGHIHNTLLSHNYSKELHKCVSVECLDDYKPLLLEKHINII